MRNIPEDRNQPRLNSAWQRSGGRTTESAAWVLPLCLAGESIAPAVCIRETGQGIQRRRESHRNDVLGHRCGGGGIDAAAAQIDEASAFIDAADGQSRSQTSRPAATPFSDW